MLTKDIVVLVSCHKQWWHHQSQSCIRDTKIDYQGAAGNARSRLGDPFRHCSSRRPTPWERWILPFLFGVVNLYYLSWEDLTFVLSPILVQLFYIKVHSCLRMCSISNVFKRLLSIIGLIGSYTSGTLLFHFPKYHHFDLKSSFELDCLLKKNSTQCPVVCGWWTERSPGRPGQHRRPPQCHRAQQTM